MWYFRAAFPEKERPPVLEQEQAYAARLSVGALIKEVLALFKMRLTSMVVISAVLGYAMGIPTGAFNIGHALLLALAGLLVTGASNALNQVLEVEADGRMDRTAARPLVKGTLSVGTATATALVAGAIGVTILWITFGRLAGVLGLLSLFMYVALYTPMKRHSAWAVFVGAFPGAIPPMLGYVAATGQFGLGPGLLFAIQFMWQFPHFWSIAWVLHDDYAKAGYHLLPSRGGRDRYSAFLTVLYTVFMILVGLLPWLFGFTGQVGMMVMLLAGLWMLFQAARLMITQDTADAKRLMFSSFIYIPVTLSALVLDKQF